MPRIALGELLEAVASVAFVAGVWDKVGVWAALVVLGGCCFYFAQVFSDASVQRSPSLPKTIRPGDTVLFRPTVDIDGDEYASLQAHLQKQLPDNRIVVVPRATDVTSWHPRGYEPPVTPSRVERLRSVWAKATARG